MVIYLMRHGHAQSGTSDTERPLSKQGRQEAAAVAQYLRQKGVPVEVFYQSTRKRAQETAQIVKDILNPAARIETKFGLGPDDPLDDILQDITLWKERTMIVSHMPFLPRLISHFLTGREDGQAISMATGSVIVLEQSQQKWKIKEIISPQDIHV